MSNLKFHDFFSFLRLSQNDEKVVTTFWLIPLEA